MKIGIIGYGYVGKAMAKLFPDAIIDDPPLHFYNKKKINDCDIAFICVPTPTKDREFLDTTIVEGAVYWCQAPLLVVRSTLNPGTVDRLIEETGKHILMQPEYLGETPRHPMNDNTEFITIGGDPKDRRKLIDLYTSVYNANVKIRQVTAYEAEVIKITDNRAVAFKLGELQELYDACEAHHIDYYTIRDAVYGDDLRFNLWWSFIYPNKRGFNSKCLPKDVYAWEAWAESTGTDVKITKALLTKNEEWLKL